MSRQGDTETRRQGEKTDRETGRHGDTENEPLLSPPCLRVSLSPCLASRGSLLGVDYGTKRIGLAVCDPDRVIASPLGTADNGPGTEGFFTELVAKSKFVGIVVGLPLHSNGDESDMSRQARAFAGRLAELTGLPVVMWDERCTSAAAEDVLLGARLTRKKRKAKVDRVAAQMILQSFLDAGCPTGGADAIFAPLPPETEPPDDSSN